MTLPLMPKATAVWLVENTALTFEQIGEFCGMHPLEIQSIADAEVAVTIVGHDPIAAGQLTKAEIERCEEDAKAKLKLASGAMEYVTKKMKGARYTPVARRADKPDAVSWLIKQYPDLADNQIIKLIGTTKSTIDAVRNRTHWNTQNLRPKDPVLLGLCTQTHLDDATRKLTRRTDGEEKMTAEG
jgi:hypothetical protein